MTLLTKYYQYLNKKYLYRYLFLNKRYLNVNTNMYLCANSEICTQNADLSILKY